MEYPVSNGTPEPGDEQEPPSRSCDTSRWPPIGASCRARDVGDITQFAECLTQPGDPCGYRISFGKAFFCWHPAHSEIAARTRRPEQTGQP
jgi:hypothetical protein